MPRSTRLLLVCLLLASPGLARAADIASGCIRIERIAAFAPRGEVYVEIAIDCGERDFGKNDSIVAHLEVHTGKAPAIDEDVRVYADEPRGRRTIPFQNLEIEPGDPLLVRLIRFGQILGLETIKVP